MMTGLSAELREPYAARFAQLMGDEKRGWLAPARRIAFDTFVAQGWPTKKQEDWRFTDIAPITEEPLLPGPAPSRLAPSDFDAALVNLGGGEAHRLVFLDGRLQPGFQPARALPPALLVAALSSPAAADNL